MIWGMVSVGVLALLLAGCGQEELPEPNVVRPIKAIKVGDPSQLADRVFPGRAKATQEVELSFRVAGPLVTRPVDVGDVVKQGDVVARIDPRDFEVSLRSVQAQLRQAKAVLERAEPDYQRAKRIFQKDPGATSEAELDRVFQNRESAAANVDALTAAEESAADDLSYTYLRAPFNGTVVATYVENFEDVRAKQPIVRIVDDSRIEMVVNIPENLISYAPDVTDIKVTFDAFPSVEVPAMIKEIGTEASEITRTYPVTLIMDQPSDVRILPGMAGRASGAPPTVYSGTAVEIPLAAVFSPEEDDKTYVWVVDEQTKTVSRREVESGQLTARGIQVTSGLEPGEWIATAGVNHLREGQEVRRLEPKTE